MKTNAVACPNSETLDALLRNRLPETRRDEWTAHLEGCARCQKALQELAAGAQSWHDAAESLDEAGLTATIALRGAIANLKAHPAGMTETPSPLTAGDTADLSFLDPARGPDEIGHVKDYRILALIGRGGFGVVYKAFDEQLHRVVALKALAPALAVAATARQRFLREARAAAKVSHHAVVTIYAVDEHRGVPFLVMEYIDGMSLQTRLSQFGALPLEESLRVAMQAAEGLAAAHAQGLVHRDVKPGNILLEKDSHQVKITDFGLARAVDDITLSETGVISGTPKFMAPEQARGETRIDHRADLFSLGSVLYTMVTGREPFCADSLYGVLHRVVEEAPASIRTLNPKLPKWLERLIAELHEKSPEKRIQSADAVAEQLRQQLAFLKDPGSRPRPSRTLKDSPAWNSWRLIGLAAVVVVALLGLFGFGLVALAFALGWADPPGPARGNGAPEFEERKGWPPPEFDEKKGPPPEFDEKKGPPPFDKKGKKGPPPPPPFDKKGKKGPPPGEFDGKKGPPPEFDGKKGPPPEGFMYKGKRNPPPPW